LGFYRQTHSDWLPSPAPSKRLDIVSATDSGGLLEIQTTTNHVFVTGDRIKLKDISISGYNGEWFITVTGADTFTLDGSVYAGVDGYGGKAIEMFETFNYELLESRNVTIPKAPKGEIIYNSGSFTTNGYKVEPNEGYYFTTQFLTSAASNQAYGISGAFRNSFKNTVYNDIVANETIEIDNVIPDISQADFISDIKSLFNLYFYTNEIERKVYIEPRDEYYSGTGEDWSDKVDISKPISISHLGAGLGKNIKFQYANDSADKYVEFKETKLNDREPWLSYETTNTNKSGKDSDTNVKLKTIAPTYIKTAISTAPSARIPVIWNSELDEVPEKYVDKWMPRILFFREDTNGIGCKTTLPSGEFWSFEGTDYNYYYEFTTNNLTTSGHDNSLDFSDTYNTHGLFQKHWRNTIETINEGRKVSMYLRLSPRDILNLDFRVPKLISLDGDNNYYHLQRISDYHPSGLTTAKCEFIKVVNPVPFARLNQQTNNFLDIEDTSSNEVIVPEVFEVWHYMDINGDGSASTSSPVTSVLAFKPNQYNEANFGSKTIAVKYYGE
jgi:hypothetical protein